MSKFILVLVVFLFSGASCACSIGGATVFKPTLERWEKHAGTRQQNEKIQGDYWEKIPAPVVQVTKIIRGKEEPGFTCADAGVLELAVSLPPDSTYSINQFGIYFRVKSGEFPHEIFPDVPVVGVVENGKIKLVLPWLDGHPKKQKPITITVEAFFVANDLSIGPSSTFLVQTKKGS